MSETPDLSTLPARMRYAATVLSEANDRLVVSSNREWGAFGLSELAANFEREDEAAEKLAEDLARDLYETIDWSGCDGSRWGIMLPNNSMRHNYLKIARFLLARGWTKAADQ